MTIRRLGGLAEEACTRSIISAFFDVYNTLGYGFLESADIAALEFELSLRGHAVAQEVSIRVIYKGREIAWQRVDMLVDDAVILEIKATPKLPPNAFASTLQLPQGDETRGRLAPPFWSQAAILPTLLS